jgi:hypothetical protein
VTSNGHRLARIAELAREIADVARAPELEKPVHELSDSECVDAWRRLCKAPIPRPDPEPFTDEEEARILAEWRALRGRQRVMTPAAADRRLAELEAEVAKLIPPAPAASLPEWVGWTTNEELDELERLYRREAEEGPEAITQADVARVLAIECQATARMLAGEPQP